MDRNGDLRKDSEIQLLAPRASPRVPRRTVFFQLQPKGPKHALSCSHNPTIQLSLSLLAHLKSKPTDMPRTLISLPGPFSSHQWLFLITHHPTRLSEQKAFPWGPHSAAFWLKV